MLLILSKEKIFVQLLGIIGYNRIVALLIISIETDNTVFILSVFVFFKFQGACLST
ncbi:uncharacterized protein METZ01_LOCUS237323 [marine metagenome]|uniref:Uncharacterized protein n=1 Tax=marine metagenome TaxID=408172 RepID=A0A382HBD6_9ZZZZ